MNENATGLYFDTSCAPYSSDVILHEAGRDYCIAELPCEECDSMIVEVNFDADGDSEGFRDCTTYRCARCQTKTFANWSGLASVERFIRVLAETMFPEADEVEETVAQCQPPDVVVSCDCAVCSID